MIECYLTLTNTVETSKTTTEPDGVPQEICDLAKMGEASSVLRSDVLTKQQTSYHLGYWQESFIHHFFVENCADGDSTRTLSEIPVDYSVLEDLRNRCYDIWRDHSRAKALLPFNYDYVGECEKYDEKYFEAVEKLEDFVATLLDYLHQCYQKNREATEESEQLCKAGLQKHKRYYYTDITYSACE